MSRVSPRLHAMLVAQSREFYVDAEPAYPAFENEAREVLRARESDFLVRCAIRRWWLHEVDDEGELRQGWPTHLVSCCHRSVNVMRDQLTKQAVGRPEWISEELMAQTLWVLQRRRFQPVSVKAAIAALQSIGRLADGRVE